jgi:tRNA(Ile)-lysidine synthase
LPNFESLARRYRFQALGKACRNMGIDSLLLAHHEDDQAETVMMRMINGHRMFGLMGIKRDSEIPECHGLHGVHESGGLDTTRNQTVAGSSPSTRALELKYRHMSPLATEIGGIRVYRPVLSFKKTRLTATCEAANMEWFEDNTNKDPTITTRNAIRHIYSSHTVPAALGASSLLNLSKEFEAKHDALLNVANSCLKGAIKTFETRTGTMSIRFPDLAHLSSSLSQSHMGLVAALLLRQVIAFITPDEHIHLHSLHGAVERLFPEIQNNAPRPHPPAFTVSGVLLKPLAAPQDRSKCTWLISRQPYASNRPCIHIAPPADSSADPEWSSWTLYDGRFWVRVRNRSGRSIVVRPLRKDDMAVFKQSLKAQRMLLRDVLRELAPGDVRWTLPAVVARDLDGGERVLGLPTLDVRVPDSEKDVTWEVTYKKVDMDVLNVEN